MDVEVNSNGVNKLIKYNILSDEKMRDIGFTDFSKDNWYFCRLIEFPKDKREVCIILTSFKFYHIFVYFYIHL